MGNYLVEEPNRRFLAVFTFVRRRGKAQRQAWDAHIYAYMEWRSTMLRILVSGVLCTSQQSESVASDLGGGLHSSAQSERIDPAVLYIAKCGHTVIQWLGLGLEFVLALGLEFGFGLGLRHFLERGFPMLLLTPSSSFSS